MDVTHLDGIALFEGLSKEQRAEVAKQADEIDVEAGKRLVSQGRFGYEFFVIENGTAEVMRDRAASRFPVAATSFPTLPRPYGGIPLYTAS